jgi:hypothetical protein
MGGIDGIMNTMTRVQKIVGTFQQMQPMFKLILGSFGGKAATKNNDESSTTRPSRSPRRRLRRQVRQRRRFGRALYPSLRRSSRRIRRKFR